MEQAQLFRRETKEPKDAEERETDRVTDIQ
jgi:hypothetical protein